jgi:hypothetical protein
MTIISGQLTTTLKTSLSFGTVDNVLRGLCPTLDNNSLAIGNQAAKMYLVSGQFTTTVKDSEPVDAGETSPTGIIWEENDNAAYNGSAQDKVRLISGNFTSTVKDSLSTASYAPASLGLSSSANDMYYANNQATQQLVIASGKFTSTVKVSIGMPGPPGASWGIGAVAGASGGDTLSASDSPNKLWLLSGAVTTTVKSSVPFTSINAGATAQESETSDVVTRLGIQLGQPFLLEAISKRKIMPYASGKVVHGKLPSADHTTVTVINWEDINGNAYTPAIGDRFIISDITITNATGANTCTLFQDLDAGNDNDAGEPIITAEFSGQGTWSQSFTIPVATQKLAVATHDVHFVSSAAGETTVTINAFITKT